jgi:GDPmannose 4,6-dehydratase
VKKTGKPSSINIARATIKKSGENIKSKITDYVKAMWLMLQQDVPDDFVIATGEQYSVKEFVERCAPFFGLKIRWEGNVLDEVGIDTITNKIVVRVDKKYFRPAEVETLLGDASKAKKKLNWSPKISFKQLVKEMVYEDLKLAKQEDLTSH